MPNAINPNDYNIEFFNSVFQGTTTVEDFREYLFSRNLPNLPPELLNSPVGNFSSFYDERGLEKDINYTPITNPGDVDEWFVNGGTSVSLSNLRDITILGENEYGPPNIQAYNCPTVEPDTTSFIQYPTSAGGGDFKDLLQTTLIDGQLNLGPGAAIDFKSDLADLGKERRKQEVINRLKLKAENLLGKVNLDPLGLLSGQDLILKDFDITARPESIGKLIETATDFVGFEIPASPIPAGAFGQWDGDPNSGNGPDNYKDIMKSTGSATKSLIFKTIARNAYGPILEERPTGLGGLFGRIGNAFSSGQAPQLRAYTDPLINEPVVKASKDELKKPLVDKINNAVGKIVDAVAFTKGVGAEEDGPSSVFKVGDGGDYMGASPDTDSITENSTFGFPTLPEAVRSFSNTQDTWGTKGPLNYGGRFGVSSKFLGDEGVDGPISTGLPVEMYNQLEDAFPHGQSMFWGKTPDGATKPFKRGILKFTQDLIDKSNGVASAKGRYIGVVNSLNNIKTKGSSVNEGTGRHDKFSMGNTVAKNNTTNEEDPWYCRSWSVRNPYSKVEDLIRRGVNNTGSRTSLTRPDFNLSVLGDNGFVKVAPYVGDSTGGFDGDTLKLGDPAVQKYMLSLENLAWQNSEEILKVAPCEVGPNGGRIMWFPPYDINFTDNSSVNWDSTSFIGRGEPIYTYNNTERTGTLSFKIVVDHSMALTEIKKQGDNALFQYFAGCDDMIEEARKILPITEINETIIEELTDQIPIPFIPVTTPIPPQEIIFYFRHAYKFEKDEVGTNLTTELGPDVVEGPPSYPEDIVVNWSNGYLRGVVPTIPPTIPNPHYLQPLLPGGLNNPLMTVATIPNPAFSASTLNEYTSAQTNSLNQLAVENLDRLVEFLLTPDGKRFQIQLVGTTSESGGSGGNKRLGKARWTSTQDYLYKKLIEKEATMKPIAASNLGAPDGVFFDSEKKMFGNADLKQKRWKGESRGEAQAKKLVDYDTNENPRIGESTPTPSGPYSALSVEAKLDRSCIIKLVYNPEIDEKYLAQRVQEYETIVVREGDVIRESSTRFDDENSAEVLAARLADRAKSYLAWECSYFEKMKQDDSFVYESLTEKLKYFHPAFHSMTPEGFNARLTFLKQCTRQGPNIAKGEPSNMAFGKPPICVLRVGDFYHTKIVIDTVNFTFDPLQWDLNPEGIGVQPMVCNVDLNFKFIGGSSLGGPISQLQNAVSHNFFANTGLYLPRTIYKSVGEYKQTRRDPITNEIPEMPDVDTRYNKDQSFAYGAYISPNQVIGLNGEITDENKALTPPKDPNEEKVKKQQAQAQTTITPAPIDEDAQKQIDEAFDKKAEERAGAFKIELNVYNGTTGKHEYKNPSIIGLCDNGFKNNIWVNITSDTESIEKLDIKYPNGETYTIGKENKGYHHRSFKGSDPKRYMFTLYDNFQKGFPLTSIPKFGGGTPYEAIEPGTYKIKAYASVKGELAVDATTETKEIVSVNEVTFKITCGINSGGTGQLSFLKEIPEKGYGMDPVDINNP